MHPAKETTPIISVGNLKGGVGKTSTTVHLAAALGELGRKVLIVYLDSSTGATSALGLPAVYLGSFEMLIGDRKAREVILSNGFDDEIELPRNVSLICGNRDLDNLKSQLEKRSGNAALQLKHELDGIVHEFDYCFLDTAPATNEATTAAYLVSRWFLMVARPEPLAVEGLQATWADLEAVRKLPYSKLDLFGVVMTCVEGKQTKLERNISSSVEKIFPVEKGLLAVPIHRTIALPRAQQQGKTLFQTDPDHSVTHEFRRLAKEFEKRLASRAAEGVTSRV